MNHGWPVYSVEIGGEPDRLELTSPNGGESWSRGSVQIITWNFQGNPGTQLKILLLKGGIIKQDPEYKPPTFRPAPSIWKVPNCLPPGKQLYDPHHFPAEFRYF